jgi:tryptophan-rich sensory protein
MNKYFIYFLSPVFYLCVALAGRAFTSQGIGPWYQTIAKPAYAPPGSIIGIIWTVIYILTSISLIIFAKNAGGKPGFRPILGLYIANGMINIAWSYIFFTKHLLGPAVIDAGLIALTVMVLMVVVRYHSAAASLLLAPYLAWVSFATYLTYVIYKMN